MNPLDFLMPWQDPDSLSLDPTSGGPSSGAGTPLAPAPGSPAPAPGAGDAGLFAPAGAATSPFPVLDDPLAGTGPRDLSPARLAFLPWEEPAYVNPVTAIATGPDVTRQLYFNGLGGENGSGASFAPPAFGPAPDAPALAPNAGSGNPLDLAITPAWAPPASPFPSDETSGFQAPQAPKTWLLAHALNNAYGFAPPPAMPQTPFASPAFDQAGLPEPARVDPMATRTTGADDIRHWYLNGFGAQNPSDASFAAPSFGRPLAGAAQVGNPLDLVPNRAWTSPASPFTTAGAPGFQAPEAPKTWLLAYPLNNAHGFAPPPAMPQTSSGSTALVQAGLPEPARVDPVVTRTTGADDIRHWYLNGFGGQNSSGASFAAPRFGRPPAGAAQAGNPLDLVPNRAWTSPASPLTAAGTPGFQAPETPKTWLLAHALNNAYGFAPPPTIPQMPAASAAFVQAGLPKLARVDPLATRTTGADDIRQWYLHGFGSQAPSAVSLNGSRLRPAPLTPAPVSILRTDTPQDGAITRAWTSPGAPLSPTGVPSIQEPETPKTWLLAHALNNAYGLVPTPAMSQIASASETIADDDTQTQAQLAPADIPQNQDFVSQVQDRLIRSSAQTSRTLDTAHAIVMGPTQENHERVASNILINMKEAQEAEARLDPQEKAIHQSLDEFGKSEGFWGTVGASGNLASTVVMNPKGLVLGMSEQVPNSLPSLAGAATGAITGMAIGAAAGTVIPVGGTGAGAAVGSFLGGRAGAAAATAILEFGNEIQEYIIRSIKDEGKEVTRENILAVLSDPVAQQAMIRQAAIKGLTLATVEAVVPGVSGKVADSTKGIVRAGIKAISDPAGEIIAEGVSSGIARGEVDKAAIAGEVIYGAVHQAAHGTAHHAVETTTHTASKASTSDTNTLPAASGAPVTERNASSDGAVKAPTDKPASAPSTHEQKARPVTRGKPVLTAPGDKPFRSEGEARAALRRAGVMEGGYNFERVKYGVIAVPKGRFLSVLEFANLPENGSINPHRIRFSQNNIDPQFKNSMGAVSDLAKRLAQKQIDPALIKPVRIVEKDGMIFTLDNRRVHAFQLAGIDIPYTKLDTFPKSELQKFTSHNNGTKIQVRRGR